MSSISSYDSSEKDPFHPRTSDAIMPLRSCLRKTEVESNDSLRSFRDTDTWSIAATLDDQESIISTNTHKSCLLPDMDDDIAVSIPNRNSKFFLDSTGLLFDIGSAETDTLISRLDTRSVTTTNRSFIAGYVDQIADGVKSDFSSTDSYDNDNGNTNERNNEERNDDQQHNQLLYNNSAGCHSRRHHHHHHHHHRRHLSHSPVPVDDTIPAPTEPQPSIATVGKTYTHLIEENELLYAQLHQLEITTRHQQNIITSIQSRHHHHWPYDDLCRTELNSGTLSKQLTTWAEQIAHFSAQWTSTLAQQHQVEQDVFHHVMEYYLHALPFGTENQVTLNTAYQDQLTRFHDTLGPNFAKWYRQRTVQSLARNPASHDYLHAAGIMITQRLSRVLNIDSYMLTASKDWQHLLDTSAKLSLELHSSEQDVRIRPLPPGSTYDETLMTAVDDALASNNSTITDKLANGKDMKRRIRSIVCPLFIDEQDMVLLPARVVLE